MNWTFVDGRVIDRPSVINMRDLGGLLTEDGAYTRRGSMFRTGSLAGVTGSDARWIVKRVALRAVIDLRTQREVARDGKPDALIALGVQWYSMPVVEDEDSISMPMGTAPYARYCRMLSSIALPLHTVIHLLARGEQLPLAFGCTAGKDRTGVLAALLLASMNVCESAISLDYALTGALLGPHVEYLNRCWQGKRNIIDEYKCDTAADHKTMSGFLEWCRSSYGSIGKMMEIFHNDSDTIRHARKRFICGM